jgi:hypothetical protein
MESLGVHPTVQEEKKNDDAEQPKQSRLGGSVGVNEPEPVTVQATAAPHYANRHVAAFLALEEKQQNAVPNKQLPKQLQVVRDGSTLSTESILNGTLSLQSPVLITDSPQSIGMKVPGSMTSVGRSRKTTTATTTTTTTTKSTQQSSKCLSQICDILGPAYPIHVIDVEHQEELEGWTLQDLLDYWQDPDRSRHDETATGVTGTNKNTSPCQQQQQQSSHSSSPTTAESPGNRTAPRRRAAAAAAHAQATKNRPRVLNQISLEFSHTVLRQQVQSPQIVRDLDWIDIAWKPHSIQQQQQQQLQNGGGGGPIGSMGTATIQEAPQVQYYCLTSSAGCYTDFHVDFGGTSVWYHILSGHKLFALVPPTETNIATYEDWLCRVHQATTFFPSLLPADSGLVMVALREHQTLLIPSGWIHAVYTSHDSIVFGGNFLHGLDIQRQIQIHSLEVRTRVQERFRFPLFRELHFAAASMYLQKLRNGESLAALEMEGLPVLMETLEVWWKGYQHEETKAAAAIDNNVNAIRQGPPTITSTAIQAARQNQCLSVDDFLAACRAEYTRVVQTGCGPSPLVPKTVVSGIVDQPQSDTSVLECPDHHYYSAPARSSDPTSSPAAPRLRLKLSSAVTAAAAASDLTTSAAELPLSLPKRVVSSESSPGPTSPRLRLKLSSSVAAAAAAARSGSNSSQQQQEREESTSSPFRINISANSSQLHAAPPVPVVVSRSTKTKREDVDWYVNEGIDVRDEEWKPCSKRSSSNSKAKDPSYSLKSQRVDTRSPVPSISTQRTSPVPPLPRVVKKKTTARQRLSKKVGR